MAKIKDDSAITIKELKAIINTTGSYPQDVKDKFQQCLNLIEQKDKEIAKLDKQLDYSRYPRDLHDRS